MGLGSERQPSRQHNKKTRQKLGKEKIKTVRGIGYILKI